MSCQAVTACETPDLRPRRRMEQQCWRDREATEQIVTVHTQGVKPTSVLGAVIRIFRDIREYRGSNPGSNDSTSDYCRDHCAFVTAAAAAADALLPFRST